MQHSCIILLLSLSALFADAQRTKPSIYSYTNSSRNYFTNGEMDSLVFENAANLFSNNSIPQESFARKYPEFKSILLLNINKDMPAAFRSLEQSRSFKSNAAVGSDSYDENKRLYTEALYKIIKTSFSNNRLLSRYLASSNSDRITNFRSTIRVGVDGKLLVTEEISVYNGNGQPNPLYGNDPSMDEAGAANNEIKRGIVRAFPLYYVNKYKLFQNTTFNLKKVLKDGEKENYHTEKAENGIRVFTGSSSVFLDNGNYTYTIIYETDHQLKFLKSYDELYWNVTGNGWSFRIDSASCTVILPAGAGLLSAKCYTGYQGDTAEECSLTNTKKGDSTVLNFRTTKALLPNQGITIAASWPKGFVKSPGAIKQVFYFTWNNRAVFLLPFAALFSAIFCFVFWFRYGRDPEKGIIYPLFEPPSGFSPAALGYIYHQKYDRQLTAATLVDAAVRNRISIDVEREGFIFKHNEYNIGKGEGMVKPPVSKYEEFESEIEDLVGTAIEKGKYNSDLGDLDKMIKEYCESNYKNKDGMIKKGYRGFFALNYTYTILPGFICVAAVLWGFIEVIFAFKKQNAWQSLYYVGGIILCVIVFRIFNSLLRSYSPEGRRMADKIEGFRLFLSTADEKRFDLMNPPTRSLELYEKYLPFAIALDCENEWGNKFEDIIESAYLDGKSGNSFSRSFSRNNNMVGSFASSFGGAISSASSPPSSSSGGGSFGGGSSGGGGGGGGGGGW